MSLVADFCASASSLAAAMLGAEPLTIGGGEAIDAVMSESTSGSAFSEIGNDKSTTLVAVIRITDWLEKYPLPVTDYIGKRANARNTNFRVGEGSSRGAAFVRIVLEDVNEVQ